MQQQLMVMLAPARVGFTNAAGSSYASGTQMLYGVWDWNVSASDGGSLGPGAGYPVGWDGISTAQYAGLTRAQAGLITLTTANLQYQTVTINATTQNRDIMTNATICWNGGCTGQAARQFGWYLNLPGSGEQVIYSRELVAQALTVNTIVPANNSPISCSNTSDTGFTYVLSAMTGGAFNTVFLPASEAANPNVANQAAYADAHAIAMQTNATGSSFITSNGAGTVPDTGPIRSRQHWHGQQ
jgi:type IV pilus assembly protein PilY1